MSGAARRDAQLAALEDAHRSALAGAGRIVLISGEAGAGKSTLVRRFADSVARDTDVLIGYCDPLSTPRPAGPLIDIATRLGEPVAGMLEQGQRRGLFDAALTAIGGRVVVFEDLHWADDLTLELLGFLARRASGAPILLVGTYRDDEVSGDHPFRAWLGTLATTQGVSHVTVPPLTLAEVTELARDAEVDPIKLHALTGGNAFYVTEVLASPGAAVPSRVADAVIARCATLSPDARHALLTAAVLGARIEPHVLLAMDGVRAVPIDECVSSGLLTFAPPVFQFRHEITRQAVLSTASTLALTRLHAEALRALGELMPDALARLAEHAEQAGDASAVLRFAPDAARRAASLGARRETIGQLRRALRFADRASDDTRAQLLAALSYELHLVADLDEALSARQTAYEVHRRIGQTAAAAEDLRWMSRISWYRGQRDEAEGYAQRSVDLLEPGGPSREIGMSYSNQSQLLMLAGRYAEAIESGDRALRIADYVGDDEIRMHALNNIGTSKSQAGLPGGAEALQESLRLALEHDMDDHAARAYVNLASGAVERRDDPDADRHVTAGLAYCAARELDLQWRYLEADRALLMAYRGLWQDAEQICLDLLQLPLISVHRYGALRPLLLVQIRRGEPFDDLLAEITAIADELNEPQRGLPVLFIRAEAAWLAGTLHELRGELETHREATDVREDAWRLAELHYWLAKAVSATPEN